MRILQNENKIDIVSIFYDHTYYILNLFGVGDVFILLKYSLVPTIICNFKKFINTSRGKYKRNECLINVCKSDKDLS